MHLNMMSYELNLVCMVDRQQRGISPASKRILRTEFFVVAVAELYARIVAIHMGIGHADAPWSSSFYIFSSIFYQYQ